MTDIPRGLLSNLIGNKDSAFDLGAYLKKEIEESVSPVTSRVDKLEKKIDLLILTVQKVEVLLSKMQPLVKVLDKIPFLK